MNMTTEYLAPSARLGEEAPENWIFLDFGVDGQVHLLARAWHEVLYRPAPDDQG